MEKLAAIALAALLAGCASPLHGLDSVEDGEVISPCFTLTYFLSPAGWTLEEPEGMPVMFDFKPSATTVTFPLEFDVQPPISTAYTFHNGSFSFGSTGHAIKNPVSPQWTMIAYAPGNTSPWIDFYGPDSLSPGMAFTLDYTRYAPYASSTSGSVDSLLVDSHYIDLNPEGGLYLASHSEEAPTFMSFTYCEAVEDSYSSIEGETPANVLPNLAPLPRTP